MVDAHPAQSNDKDTIGRALVIDNSSEATPGDPNGTVPEFFRPLDRRRRMGATICNVSIAMRPGATSVNPWAGSCRGDGADQLLIACQAADSVSRGSIARTAFRVSADRSAFRRS